MANLKTVTVKIEADLHKAISDYVSLMEIKMQDLVGQALRRELDSRLAEGGEELRAMLARMREFRESNRAA